MKKRQWLRRFAALGIAACVVAGFLLIGRASSNWSPVAGQMSEARELSQAVVLADGRVLVIGGVHVGALSMTVDIYDPRANAWATPAAPLHTGRYYFASTLLQDGRVLVAGGITVETVDGVPTGTLLASTEIYDPAQDAWTQGPDLPSALFASKAVTLGDGRVLMVGGFSYDGQLSSAALYDPSTNAWTPGPAMSVVRVLPDATPLGDGRILVTGGFTNDEVQSSATSAELFDPRTNSWAPAGQMSTGHTLGIATRLQDGHVLVAGGASSNINPTFLTGADLYDPTTNSWQPVHPMSIERLYFAGGLLADGSVVVAGGLDSTYAILQSAERYDAQRDVWTLMDQSLSAPRAGTASAAVGDRLLVAGGLTSRDPFTISDTGEAFTLNRAPIALASADPSVTAGVPGSLAAVTLSAAGSSDPENDPLTFTWSEGTSTLASIADPVRTSTVGLGVGVHNITLTADDGFGGTSTTTVAVTVQDATAPLQAQIAALAAQNVSLTAENRDLQRQLSASQQAIADAVSTVQGKLRIAFRDPSFTIPGDTPAARLRTLIRAVVRLPDESLRHLYRILGGASTPP